MVILPYFLNFAILPLLLADEAPRQPLFVTLLGDKHLKKIKEIEKD
jgi:hypothetical protein